MGRFLVACVFVLLFGQEVTAQQINPPSEAIVQDFLHKRADLLKDERIDLMELSRTQEQIVRDSYSISQTKTPQEALAKLKELEKYRPLAEYPSFNVQANAAALYVKLDDPQAAAAFQERTAALAEILIHRIGSGKTPQDPLEVLHPAEFNEWAPLYRVSAISAAPFPLPGRPFMMVATVHGATPSAEPQKVYFDPLAVSHAHKPQDIFAPLALDTLPETMKTAYTEAKTRRDSFLNDENFNFFELNLMLVSELPKANKLMMDKKFDEASGIAKRFEEIHPIELTPVVPLLMFYSALQGVQGNQQKQIALRRLIFGAEQVIAHSGDGSSEASAVEVVADVEEHAWIAAKGLTLTQHRTYRSNARQFDVMTTRNAAGQTRDVYFDVTRSFARSTHDLSLQTQDAAHPEAK